MRRWFAAAAVLAVAVACGSSKKKQPPSPDPEPPPPPSDAAPPADEIGPWLWKVEKAGVTSHLFGTINSGVMAAELPPVVWQTLAASKRMVLDAGPAAQMSAADEKQLMELDGTTLEKLLGADYPAVRDAFLDMVPLDQVPTFRPWLVLRLGLTPEIPASDMPAALAAKATEAGLEMVDVAVTAQFQQRVLDDEINRRELIRVAGKISAERERDYLQIEAYRAGSLGAVRELARRSDTDPEGRAMLGKVGAALAMAVAAELAKGDAFVQLPLSFLFGDADVLARLKKQGYSFTRVGVGTHATLVDKVEPFVTRADCDAARDRYLHLSVSARLAELDAGPDQRPAVAKQLAGELTFNMRHCLTQATVAQVRCSIDAADLAAFKSCGPT